MVGTAAVFSSPFHPAVAAASLSRFSPEATLRATTPRMVHQARIPVWGTSSMQDFLQFRRELLGGEFGHVQETFFVLGDVAFICNKEGVAVAVDVEAQELSVLNLTLTESIAAIHPTESHDAVIILGKDHSSATERTFNLRCLKIQSIKRMKLEEAVNLLPVWPSSIQFDIISNLLLARYRLEDGRSPWSVIETRGLTVMANVWVPRRYKIAVGDGVMVAWRQVSIFLDVLMYSLTTGEPLARRQIPLARNKIDFVIMMQSKLFIKQRRRPLRIVDLATGESVKVTDARAGAGGYLFPLRHSMFVTTTKQQYHIWNMRGELVTSYKKPQGLARDSLSSVSQAVCASFYIIDGRMHFLSLFSGETLGSFPLTTNKGEKVEPAALYHELETNSMYTIAENGGWLDVWR